MIKLRPFQFACAFLVWGTAWPAFAELLISDAWIAAAPPGVRTMAGYFSVANEGAHDSHIVGATSPDFERIELHAVVSDGQMHGMRELEQITVPAGDTISLAPGERHLMLIDGGCHLKSGDSVFVKLRLSDNVTLPVTFEVRSRDTAAAAHNLH